jgi:DNA topoisomerase-1
MTHIERLQRNGIRRLGTSKRGFRYEHADGGKVSRADRERIELLRIPPAWTDVAINSAANGRLQAVGQDAAGRWQYLYHENHTRSQDARKFQRLIKFAQALPAMRTTIAKHLRQPDLGRERVLACVLRILSTCFLRSGSEVYASENGSYGLATLRRKHVKVRGDVVEFDFPGKSGVRQTREIRDRQVARVVRGVLKEPGFEVFKYKNGSGQFVDLKSRHINEYIKEVMGGPFSAKDFRTWAGTLVCACALARAGSENGEKKADRKKKIVAAIKETAQTLGNTPAVCRGSYICPEILIGFESGKIIDSKLETLQDFVSYRGRKLHPIEKSLLNFLKRNATI